jgi:hypothetical protein
LSLYDEKNSLCLTGYAPKIMQIAHKVNSEIASFQKKWKWTEELINSIDASEGAKKFIEWRT